MCWYVALHLRTLAYLNLRAGSLQTPHVLELSGIGNSNLLSKYGIQTLVDLPSVGENLRMLASYTLILSCSG